MTAAATLIGRETSLDRIGAHVERVADGASAAVVLTGLPGVGKTALAQAALHVAARRGFATYAGRARPLTRDVAYAALVEAFGPPLRAMPPEQRADTLRDLSPLALVFTGLGVQPPPPLGDPALERSRVLDAFVRLAERLAAGRPLALLVDDAHALDDASAAVLVHLAAGIAGRPVLLLLTARSEDRAGVDELTVALAESATPVDHHDVLPLDDEDSARLVRAVLAGAVNAGRVDEEVVTRTVARCGGRPLLLDATARTIAESRGAGADEDVDAAPIPADVHALLRGRLTGCTPDERAVVDVLAVAGDTLGFDVIARAGELEPAGLATALDRLERRGLVRTQDGGFDLAHGLLREVAAAELSGILTQRTHARLVSAMQASDPDDPRVAHHALGAGPLLAPARALELLAHGGGRARDLGMNEIAVRYLAAAAELAETQADVVRRSDLVTALADAHRRLGSPAAASREWQRARDGYARAGHMEGVARVEQDLGLLDWARGELADAREHFARAERALAGLEPSPAHAALLHTRTVTASRVGDSDTVAQTARALRRLAGELGSATLEAQAYLAEAVLDYAAADYVAMLDRSRRALAAARRGDDPLLVIRAHDQISVAAASQLDLPLLREHSRNSLQLARDLGSAVLEGWPRGRLAVADLLAGDWDEALRASSELVGLPRRYGEQRGAVSTAASHAWILTHRGRLEDARRYLAEARENATPTLADDRNIFSIVAVAACWLALAEDDPQRALENEDQLENTTGGWLPLLGLALLGEARTRAGDTAGAEQIAHRFAAIRSCATIAPRAMGDWVGGLAAARTGRPEPATERLLASAAAFDTLGVPFLAARTRLAAAETAAAGHADDAIGWARAALATFDGLGAPIEAQRSRDLLRRLGVVPSRGRVRRSTGSALSRRELEVARAVASGLSNAEVARALFISPRTVTTHLDRIYSRLGLGSRAALTRYLADGGLLGEPGEAAAGGPPNT